MPYPGNLHYITTLAVDAHLLDTHSDDLLCKTYSIALILETLRNDRIAIAAASKTDKVPDATDS